jgi:F-type H+-transporting ATPase subunit gamma
LRRCSGPKKNIDELLENLNGTFHRLRQSGIDGELFDVISGYEALAKGNTHRNRGKLAVSTY